MNKIMVVDDEPSQLKAIKRIFSETEYELSLLQEGQRWLRLFGQEPGIYK